MTTLQQEPAASAVTYRMAPGLEVIALADDAWLCQSDTASVRISGPAARLFVEALLPLLQEGAPLSALAARAADADPQELRLRLDELVANGVLRRDYGSVATLDSQQAPLLRLLDGLGMSATTALARLATARIAIIGLEGVGAELALLLARSGLRHFMLADPFQCQPGDLPSLASTGASLPRQDLVAAALRAASPAPAELHVATGPDQLTPEAVERIVADSDCVVSLFDRGFAAIHHWVNRASLRQGVPALYAAAAGHQGWAGPLVLPGRTGCYMCYRMRAIACAEDSGAALAYERVLVEQNTPRLHSRALWPSLLPQLAGLLGTAVLQVALGLEQPVLAGRVREFQALTLTDATHPVLQQPDCPDCSGKGGGPHQPGPPELLARGKTADLLSIASDLISPHSGIIREAIAYHKDAVEPALPYICEAMLANHRYQDPVQREEFVCWGKGFTYQQAYISAIGECVERYSADWVDRRAIVYARRAEFDGPSLDPAELVLYAAPQYATLPYQSYDGDSIIGWVRGRSLISGELVYLPALTTFMGYEPHYQAEYLCQVTSNGVAAGSSLAAAVLAAAYEVMERDAFMITWFARLPARRVDAFSHPEPQVRELCRLYQRRGVEIMLWRLPTDHPGAVCLAIGLEQPGVSGPAAVVGLGADLSPAAAARKAILEVGQIRPSYRSSMRRSDTRQRIAELVADPQRVATMHDHGLLYCSPAMLPALAFLLEQPVTPTEWTPNEVGDTVAQLERLLAYFRAAGQEFLYYNLTPPELARRSLAAARVILPGFQPVAFGAQEMRLGGERLFTLPQQLGLAPACLSLDQLNPYPHPFD